MCIGEQYIYIMIVIHSHVYHIPQMSPRFYQLNHCPQNLDARKSRLLYVTRLGKPSIWIFSENWVVGKLYHRDNSRSSFRIITRFAVEPERLVWDRATPPIFKKLRSKGVAMHMYGVSVYHVWTGNQLNGPGWSRLKWKYRLSEFHR